jgi:hypothetical protein
VTKADARCAAQMAIAALLALVVPFTILGARLAARRCAQRSAADVSRGGPRLTRRLLPARRAAIAVATGYVEMH